MLAAAGAVGCFLLCLLLGSCEAFTLYTLSKFSERYSARTYSVLIRKALGRKLSACVWPPGCSTVCPAGPLCIGLLPWLG